MIEPTALFAAFPALAVQSLIIGRAERARRDSTRILIKDEEVR